MSGSQRPPAATLPLGLPGGRCPPGSIAAAVARTVARQQAAAAAAAPSQEHLLEDWDRWLLRSRSCLVHLAVKLLGEAAASGSHAVLIDTCYHHPRRFSITDLTIRDLDWLHAHRPNVHTFIATQKRQAIVCCGDNCRSLPSLVSLILTCNPPVATMLQENPPTGPRPAEPAIDQVTRVASFRLQAATLAEVLADPRPAEHWLHRINCPSLDTSQPQGSSGE